MTVVPIVDLPEWVGRDLGPSEWLDVDQNRIDTFADVTGDHQFIHVDPEAAARTPFGSTIAHGFLSLSLLTRMCAEFTLIPESLVMGLNYGLDRVRFLTPVKVGSRVRAKATVGDIALRSPGRWLARYEVTVEIEGEDRPALVAQWLVMWIVQ